MPPNDSSPEQLPATSERIAIERHRRGNRWMHWINFPVLTIMIWSGLRIYVSDVRDPYVFGLGSWEWFAILPRNNEFTVGLFGWDWFSVEDLNTTLGLRRRLAKGLAFHFTFGWFFTLNAIAFAGYLMKTGGWRNFVPTLDDLKTIPAVLLHELKLRKEPPPQGKYNGVQQLSYGIILLLGVLAILTGFAIYKPTQLAPLTWLLGGYETARFLHFSVTMAFMGFFVIHMLQVARAGFGNFWSMVTGYELMPAEQAEDLIEPAVKEEELSR